MKHGRGWEGAAPESNAAWRGVRRLTSLPVCWCRVWVFFFFYRFVSTRLDSTRLLFLLILAKLGRFGQNQAVSAESGRISRRLKWPKQAKIGLESFWNSQNRLWMRPKHPKSVLNFILNICCFFCVFFFVLCFVLCFLPSSFFVL